MAKSKNHTNHNQGHKNHKNGIKKPRRQKYISTKGMHQKFVLNQRYARAGSEKALRAQKKKAAAAAAAAAAPAAANAAAPATDKQ